MALTQAQLVTLKAAIAAETDTELVGYRTDGSTGAMAAWYSQPSSPAFIVWRSTVMLREISNNVDGLELVGLTAIKLAAYQCLLLAGSVDASNDRTRDAFDRVFSAAGGAVTRPLLLAIWKRSAKRIEKMFAIGTGSDAAPATMVHEGSISNNDLVAALQAA